jgi:hypothetical protein
VTIKTEFIVDLIKKYDNYAGFENVIAYIEARWKITDSAYPNGAAYHVFRCKLDLTNLNSDTYKPIGEITNEEMEAWCTKTIPQNEKINILNNAIGTIIESHEINSMTVYYVNPNR